MSDETPEHADTSSKSFLTVKNAAIAVVVIWSVGGLLPALLALADAWLFAFTPPYSRMDWSARLGTFGDWFAGANTLISSLAILAAAYSFEEERKRREEERKRRDEDEASNREIRRQEEKTFEDQREHQAKLAMLAILMQARIAISDQIREDTRTTSALIAKSNPSPKNKSPYEKVLDNLNTRRNVNANGN